MIGRTELSESGKHCSHGKSFALLTSPFASPFFLTTWSFNLNIQITFVYSAAFSLRGNYCLNMHARLCVTFTSNILSLTSVPVQLWLMCFCGFSFSDIPRIPDTSHPPLESSRYLLWHVETALCLFVTYVCRISVYLSDFICMIWIIAKNTFVDVLLYTLCYGCHIMSYKLKGIVQNFEIFSSFLRIRSCVNESRKTERTTSKVFKRHYSTVHKNVKK